MDTMDLTDNERTWIKEVWDHAKISKKQGVNDTLQAIPSQIGRIKKDAINRWKVLMGMMQAGNDNPALLTELSVLGKKMNSRGWISDEDYDKLRELIALGP